MRKLKWYLKQALPLSYWTKYRDADDRQHFCAWRMWFGRVFDCTDVVVG